MAVTASTNDLMEQVSVFSDRRAPNDTAQRF
jgi:hypothetical protein